MEDGIGIGRDLSLLEMSGDLPPGHRDFASFVHATWRFPRHYVVAMMNASGIVDRLAGTATVQEEPTVADLAFRERVARWGNVSAVLLIKHFSPADQLLIAKKAFALAGNSMPTATHVRKAIIHVLGRVGVHEADRRTRDRAEAAHEVGDAIKQIRENGKGSNVDRVIRTLKRAKDRIAKRSSKYFPRTLS
jgi:hypothetical protein